MTAPARGRPVFREDGLLPNPQDVSRGVRITHMIGSAVIVAGMPLLAVKPRAEAPTFLGGWLVQIAGHWLFEHNLPSTHKGWITFQLTGMIDVCEQYGELLARRSQRKAALKDAPGLAARVIP